MVGSTVVLQNPDRIIREWLVDHSLGVEVATAAEVTAEGRRCAAESLRRFVRRLFACRNGFA